MEITDQVREAVMREVMAELKQYGHAYAALHVESCRKRLSVRINDTVLVPMLLLLVVEPLTLMGLERILPPPPSATRAASP